MVADKEETLEQYLRERIPGDYERRDAVKAHTEHAAEEFANGDTFMAEFSLMLVESARERMSRTLEDFKIKNIPESVRGDDIERVVDEFYSLRGFEHTETIMGAKVYMKESEGLFVNVTYASQLSFCLVTIQRVQ